MTDSLVRLNEVLANERACLRALQRAETAGSQNTTIQRIRANCAANCDRLADVIRALNGSPTDTPSVRFSLKLTQETCEEALDMARSAQEHILDALAGLLDEPELKSTRGQLTQVWRLHQDDVRLLKATVAGQ